MQISPKTEFVTPFPVVVGQSKGHLCELLGSGGPKSSTNIVQRLFLGLDCVYTRFWRLTSQGRLSPERDYNTTSVSRSDLTINLTKMPQKLALHVLWLENRQSICCERLVTL